MPDLALIPTSPPPPLPQVVCATGVSSQLMPFLARVASLSIVQLSTSLHLEAPSRSRVDAIAAQDSSTGRFK